MMQINMGLVRYLFQRHAQEVAAELSREMKMELMQDMLISSRYALEQFRLKRPDESMPLLGTRIFTIAKPFCLGSEWGYMAVEVEPKKFSKYFHFLATF